MEGTTRSRAADTAVAARPWDDGCAGRCRILKTDEGDGLRQGIHRFLRNAGNLDTSGMSRGHLGGADGIHATGNSDY